MNLDIEMAGEGEFAWYRITPDPEERTEWRCIQEQVMAYMIGLDVL